MFPFAFETHQDVEKNLVVVMVVLLFVLISFLVLIVLPPHQKQALLDLVRRWPIAGIVASSGGLLAVIGVVAVILVWALQVHLVYDRYVVGWRAEYDTKVILAGLSQPFSGKLDRRFLEVAEKNRYRFMKDLFYPYVHDRGDSKDPKDPIVVNQNKLARFYENVTKYWTTELIEIVLYSMLLIAVIYLPVYRRLHLSCRNLALSIAALLVLLAMNAWLARKSLIDVREITDEQIQDIHDRFNPDLDQRLSKISAQFGLTYR